MRICHQLQTLSVTQAAVAYSLKFNSVVALKKLWHEPWKPAWTIGIPVAKKQLDIYIYIFIYRYIVLGRFFIAINAILKKNPDVNERSDCSTIPRRRPWWNPTRPTHTYIPIGSMYGAYSYTNIYHKHPRTSVGKYIKRPVKKTYGSVGWNIPSLKSDYYLLCPLNPGWFIGILIMPYVVTPMIYKPLWYKWVGFHPV